MMRAEERNTEKHELFSLSLNQRNIWNLEQVYSGTSLNNISTTIRIQGRLDFPLLQETINQVIEKDPTLRTRIVLADGEPMQYSADYGRETFPVYDFSQSGESGRTVWEETLAREAMPLLEAPLYRFALFRTGEHDGGVYVKVHHIVSDGWSQALICNRIAETYFHLLSGEEPQLEEAPEYRLHIREEEEYLSSRHYQRDQAYWADQLKAGGEPAVLREVQGAAVSPVGCRLSFDLPQHLNHAIYTFCMRNRVAPFAVFYMALATYFKRIGGADRFTIGVPIFNRTNFQFRQSTGMFVSTLPFINEVNADWSFHTFNTALAENWLEMLRHQRFPFRDICAMAGKGEERLFQIALSYQNSKLYESHDARVMFSGRWHYSGYQAEQLCIHLSNLESVRQYAVDYDYLTQLFTREEIAALHNSLVNLLTDALACPDKPIHELSMLAASEREQIIYSFNRTARYLEDTGVYACFCRVAEDHPERAALICGGERMTYAQLKIRSAAFAGAIRRAAGEKARGLAAVVLPRDFTLYGAMMGILRMGWAYLLIAEDTPVMRAVHILEQSGADVLICSSAMGKELRLAGAALPAVAVDLAAEGEDDAAAEAGPEDLAYVVYTSGSTGTPKGVEITQRSLLNLSRAMAQVYGGGALLSMCSVGFDAFVLESAAALLNGCTIVLPSPAELESPRRLAGLIRSYAVGTLITTPSRLMAMLRDPDFRRGMGRIESVVCGGEAFPRELLYTLSACSSARIYNQYGPSETTVAVSHKLLNNTSAITAGAPLENCRLYVLDAWRNPLPAGVFGELYIGGICVGRGYRNDPALTEERFFPSPFETGERIYRTGDLACWTKQGEIVLAGRRDRQVKLRGLRVEPQEIVSCLCAFPGISGAAVRLMELSGQTVIVGYYAAERSIREMELLNHLSAYLPPYMVPAALCRVAEIPLTGNGKVDEQRLPVPEWETGGAGAPADGTTRQVQEAFSRDLQEKIGPDDDYFLHGGSSLTAMCTLSSLEEETGCALRISDLYACRTARRLARCIAERMGTAAEEESLPAEKPAGHSRRIGKAPVLERYPLSPIQRGIYFQSVVEESGILYNMPGVFRLAHMPDPCRLEEAFRRLITGEPSLRTVFQQEEDGVFARVLSSVDFTLQNLQGNTVEEIFARFLTPFSLDHAPLLRCGLWQGPEGEGYLFLDTHHLISDGLTTPILLRRLDACYRGEEPVLPALNYLDYAYAMAERKGPSPEDGAYWTAHLTPLPAPLVLPSDNPRSGRFDYRGRKHTHRLPAALSQQIECRCREQGSSVFSLFLAAYGRLLAAVSGQETFTVGMPVAGRGRKELREVCGPLLNILPARIQAEAGQTAEAYVAAVGQEVADLLDHSDCTQEELFSLLHLQRDPAVNPLYRVTMSLRPFAVDALRLGGEKLELQEVTAPTAKAELGLEVAQEGEGYVLHFEYASGLFAPETIALYGRSLEWIIRQLLDGGEKPLGQVETVSPQDRITLFARADHLCVPYVNLPVHEMIRQQALLQPEETAVIFHGEEISRSALERRACRIASALCAAGVCPGSRVGLSLGRTPELLAAMLGILKAGCAYVPLLSTLPEKRLCYMAETAETPVILADEQTAAQLPAALAEKVLTVPQGEGEDFASRVSPDGLINVLFTSGSTGQPKGVMVRHQGASNLLSNLRPMLEGITGSVICANTMVFDIFLVESLIPLAVGRTVVLADEEEMLLPWRMAELIQRHQVSFLQLAASKLAMCLTNDAFCAAARRLEVTIIGGEQALPSLVETFKACCPDGRLVNCYGPTEATVCTTMTELFPGEPVTIGRPMGNCRVYVMDAQGRRVMPTAQGEMYLAGTCVAAGYLGRPDLTEKAFLPDPYVPGEMMYRSGDLGRLRWDGKLDCLGRCDGQVKINGQRLELGEIVDVLLRSGLVAQAAVVPVPGETGQMTLHAFCVRRDGDLSAWQDIADALGQYLPAYMIPARFHLLADMPSTPGGKADLQLLQQMAAEGNSGPEEQPCGEDVREAAAGEKPALSPEDAETADEAPLPQQAERIAVPRGSDEPADSGEGKPAVPPENLEETLLAIWAQVLRRTDLSADRSFFDQGGTSLDTLTVLSRYFNRGIKLSVTQFYQHPTARAQAALLTGGKGKDFTSSDAEQANTRENTRGDETRGLPRYVPPCLWQPGEEKTLFLTGATGYFGAHLLRALLQQGAERILCLVRGGEERLIETLTWYFGAGWTARARRRIHVVSGDLRRPLLGLSREEWTALVGEVHGIYHAAADVRHFVGDQQALMDNNLEGTKTMIRLALAADVPLYLMSTLSVGGEYLVDAPEQTASFTEHDCDLGQNWSENVYVRSKMLSEGAVYRAIADQGLKAKVFRLGRLIWRREDGVFQRNPQDNMTFLLCRAIRDLGVLPQSLEGQTMDMTPVDWAAEAVAALRHCGLTTLHIMNPTPVPAGRMLQMAMPGLAIVPRDRFLAVLEEKMAQENGGVYSLLAEYLRMRRLHGEKIHLACSLTVEAMAAAGFSASLPDVKALAEALMILLDSGNG